MSLVSDCNSDTNTTALIKMTDLSINMTSIDPVVTLTPDPTGAKSAELVNVGRSGGEWLPVSFNEIPITNNTLNIAINNTEIRPNITNIATITTNTRSIAPKPVTSALPIRQDNIVANVSAGGDNKTQTVIITTTSDSVVNPTTSGNKYGINKVIPISSHIALVTSPDGQMLAVPMTSLMTKGNVNIKPNVAPVSINSAALKAKSSLMTPLKILPLIASTTSSTSITVPTISHSKNVQTLIAPNSMAMAKGIANTSLSNTGVTLFPASIPKSILSSAATEPINELSIPSITAINPSNIEIKTESTDETIVKSEECIQSPLPPPLLSQSCSILTIPIPNSMSLTPPTLTSLSTTATNSSTNANLNSDPQNKLKIPKLFQNDTNSITGIEEMDSVIEIMEWKDGIGVLPGSDLKFRIDEFGHLDMINEPEMDSSLKNGIKEEMTASEPLNSQESDKSEINNESIDCKEGEPLLTCINCGSKGAANTFIRQGRFCGKSCATLESTHLKLYTKRNAELALVKGQEIEKKKTQIKKPEVIKVRPKPVEQNTIVLQTENSNQTIDAEMESNEDANEEVEDVETTAGDYTEHPINCPNFSWRQYLNKTNSMAATVKCFDEFQTFPTMKNGFKVGMKLEGVDPQHPSKFCILTVAEVCGFRIRLHFDGYKELFDFWVNADNQFIFPINFCEQTQRKLEPPLGLTPDEFNWDNYLKQTKSVSAPEHVFSYSNLQQSVTPNGFRVGMKLEAVDRANTALVCVATIADMIGNWLLIHFDGWDDSYDYWAETTSPYIHAINWCRTKGRSLTPPKDYYRSSERFAWEEYLSESKSMAVSSRLFKARLSNNFKVGLKLEVVDKRNPRLIRVCSVSHRQSHSIKIHFDGWDEKYDYWVDDDSPDIHPVNWCHKTGHPLQPPPITESDLKKESECPTPGCNGIGHIRGPKYMSHHSAIGCPYTDSRLEYELPDRLGNSSNRNSDELPNEELDENQNTPSQSPCPSESNSVNSTQKSQKTLKSQQISANSKPRKHKLGASPSNGTNGPVSPSTNSESAKHSRPSTPSSVTNLSNLQHSIFAMRMSQQQQEAPICWDRHSKTTLPGIDKTKSKDVLLWSPSKVAEFIDQIPGCEAIGQVFQDQLIDGEAFLLLNQNDIVKILGLKLGPAVKIFNSILVIRDNAISEDVV